MSTDLEENPRRDIIIGFIIEHDNCIKTEVEEYMGDKSPIHASVVTTHKILKSLVESGTVIVKPDEKNSQIHHLSINNNYSIIHRELTAIESLMNGMDAQIHNARQFLPPNPPNDEALQKILEDHSEKYSNQDDLWNHFIYPYEDAVFMMLRILYVRITKMILSKKDTYLLRTKITDLMLRLTSQIFNLRKEKHYLDFTIMELKTFRLSTTKAFADKNRINIKYRQKVISKIEDFEKIFLTEKG